jgi:hypothetical protein
MSSALERARRLSGAMRKQFAPGRGEAEYAICVKNAHGYSALQIVCGL